MGREVSRRGFLKAAGAASGAALLAGCSAGDLPLDGADFPSLDKGESFVGLATSLTKELDYPALVEGQISRDLQGTLYRNGPGLFDRNGLRKRCILDGDGMVQAIRISNGKARFQNRFVRTEKFLKEEASGRFQYETWTTQRPGGWLVNIGANIGNQAGVTVIRRGDHLYAFDESAQPYELNPDTLETVGLSRLGLPDDKAVFAAHWKVDGATGDWIHFGIEYGSESKLHVTTFDRDGRLARHRVLEMPRETYMHDFFVSQRHIIFNLLAVDVSVFSFALGTSSFAGTFHYRDHYGNILLIIEREGDAEPVRIETESAWMWHTLNAYEEADEIIADFVGYKDAKHFIGKDPGLYAIMEGRMGEWGAPGQIRRYVINLKKKRVKTEVLDRGNHEFPIVNPRLACNRHRYGYFAATGSNEILYSSIIRVDMESGETESYDFGKGHYCGEPVFAPRPYYWYADDPKREPGWILTEVYSSHTRNSYIAILDAEGLFQGPQAIIHLDHHVPLSFHGYWHAGA
ncbi:MAG: carotenoid oxygenase family protein [Deltaproteobacteria bacterium]|nr:carotenoid oxygenase family protein [Deltaproteobacteria bacterium]